ncbi:hypothetical protein CW736_08490 [Nonlabens sp. MB-3u-79]|jgi:hypothetical protein|uniref:heavy metal-binding domain-containing protein n=1 Tax=Nonlabens sp. MB-3u-79 TaxID=2058134 RepID=UPI000C304061|nr:heavy metal-binding domain-containing protein [Nonlabens sp. MB-3u-79]AUC79411.1 hypothetical protein CW736_08490 [Nonlabens sp. MB-3u-79]|tara:strand:- start:386 stop:637 length:252 start_codon:yes stop_codon:yes gene_type:complete
MKNLKSILGAMLLMATISIVSCKENEAEAKPATEVDQGDEYTSAYVCPMHCKDSGSDKEGTCDSCGMTLIKNEEHTANGHTHE